MNDIEFVFGTGDGIVHHWSGQAELALADTGVADALWLSFDGDTGVDDAPWDSDRDGAAESVVPDIPLVVVDHRAVLAQEPAGALSRPPWLDGH
ncbi:hypothetical protein ATM97_16395 [Nocardia sp. MH4]|uniref:hypothetical protein n=1 Tax=Nocardia sp. MH4 TaxID=1768677 RepID=UPI001C4E341F|nr:hypothetical protein [Nocardia sp. MH4]MBW0275834.1 hypothetical protein [Nocardia sp. MH4]